MEEIPWEEGDKSHSLMGETIALQVSDSCFSGGPTGWVGAFWGQGEGGELGAGKDFTRR